MGNRMKTILIVDDDEMILKMAEFILQQDGYDVVKCTSGMSGLEYFRHGKADLILLDVEMPIMSGLQTLEILKSNEELADIPVMFLTANADVETVAAACSLGAVEYVVKPFMPNDLNERVKKILKF